MSPEEFQIIVTKIRPFTDYVYLHVLGEPLLHPQLDEIITIAEKAGLNINITTNGSLLERKKEILMKHSIRQINISLHDAEENIAPEKWENYLKSVLDFAVQASPKIYINLRFWNTSNESSKAFNNLFIKGIAEKFQLTSEELLAKQKGNGLKLAEHTFLQLAPRFEWPDEKNEKTHTRKTCYALRDHIAILADGQIVPCCLDANANMKLGNIFEEELADILNNERSKKIKNGFQNHAITEEICKTCGFIP
jgi:radical SAM protein with 4Fe4S-binding SPASM domain